jgi:hypothetical protein
MSEFQETDRSDEGSEGNTGFREEWARLRSGDDRLPSSDGGRDDPEGDDAEAQDAERPGGLGDGKTVAPPEDRAADRQDPAARDEPADVWASAPAELREAFQAEREARVKAQNHNRTQNSRLSQLTARLHEIEAAGAHNRAPGAEAPEGGDGEGKSREDRIKAMREEYPDLAAPLLDEMDRLRQEMSGYSSRAVADEKARFDAHLDQQEALLLEEHPDWQTATATPEWAKWLREQPPYVQQGIARNGSGIVDATEAADILTRFKAATNAPDPRREAHEERRRQQLEGGRTGTVRTPATPAGDGADDYQTEWQRLRAQEKRRQSQGSGR